MSSTIKYTLYIILVALISLSCIQSESKWFEHFENNNRSESQRSRTPEQKRNLLFGNETTLECGKQLNFTKPSRTPRVIGGRAAIYGEFPWQVSLSTNEYDHICGGTIIGSHWVLTAAHCLPGAERILILGAIDLTTGLNGSLIVDHVKAQIAASFIHPEFNKSTLVNDIALIKTVGNIDLTGQELAIGPACLPDKTDEKLSGNAILSGFGLTGLNTRTSVLMTTDLALLSYETCTNHWEDPFPVTRKHLCAGAIGGSTGGCKGDSGGPLVQFNDNRGATLIGILSWVGIDRDGRCDQRRPTVFVNVYSYNDWIFDIIDINQ